MVKKRDVGWLAAKSDGAMLGRERKWYLGRDTK
jgi:hypothetical protein